MSDLPQHSRAVQESSGILSADYREMPYWWMQAAPEEALREAHEVGGAVDVAIVGAGVTGSVAALKLARGGASVMVFDKQDVGAGAARRNAGFLGRTLKRSIAWLEAHHGAAQAAAIYRELDEALRGLALLVEAERIDCHRRTCGRLIAANSFPHLRVLLDDLQGLKDRLGFDYDVLDRNDMRREIASDAYVGGAIVPDLGSIHPGLYHQGLVRAARSAGVRYVPRTEVHRIDGTGPQQLVRTSAGAVTARHVIVATNGYTSPGSASSGLPMHALAGSSSDDRRLSWFARRVIPFRGFAMVTEQLPRDLVSRVFPHRRTYLDTRMNIDFMRPVPGSDRILFGGMTGSSVESTRELSARLHARMVRALPDLAGVKIGFGWTGHCAGTFDFMPHIGERDGIHFALGYNFAGLPIGTHFGTKLARRILGQEGADSVFERASFPGHRLYRGSASGNAWFVPLAMRVFDWKDARLAARPR